VAEARSGDKAAFGLLVRRYQNLVCAMAYSRLGDVENAHDVAQEAFLVSFEKLPVLRSGKKFGAWLRGITQRLCNQWQRSAAYRRELQAALRERVSEEEMEAPEDAVAAKENEAILKGAIDRLPERLRDALVLHYFEEQSLAETARELGISKAAAVKRVQRARRLMRGYVSSKIEAGLRKARPRRDFARRTVAAIPIGSICGKLGIDVARVGVGEALAEATRAAGEHASTILTGGGVIMAGKKAVVTAAAVILLAAGGTGYLVIRHGRGGMKGTGAETTAAEVQKASPEEGASGPVGGGEAGRVRQAAGPLQQLSLEQINELVRKGSPELDAMDEETRLETIRHLLRDALERTMSLKAMREVCDVAGQFWQEGKKEKAEGKSEEAEAAFKKAVAIYLAVYDVASNPENYAWAVKDGGGKFMGDLEGVDGSLAIFMAESAEVVRHLLGTGRLERTEEVEAWRGQVLKDMTELTEEIASGRDGATLMMLRNEFEPVPESREEREERYFALNEEVAQYLEGYLRKDDLTPEDRWGTTWTLAELILNLERYDEAAALYGQLMRDAEAYGYDAPDVRYKLEWARGEAAVGALPAQEQAAIKKSLSNVRQISAALFKYSEAHEQKYPGDLKELVEGGYTEARVLVDPFTGEPYEYTAGLSREAKGYEVLLRTKTKNGLSICHYAGYGSGIVKVEE